MQIAVIGSGISGSLVARLLATRHEITLFEANGYAGGHANTVDLELAGQSYQVDTGFMVFNHRTYPNFCRLLELLGIPSQPSDMSFSVRCSQTQLEYQGSSLNGLFAQRRNCCSPSFLRMVADILRFNRLGRIAASSGELLDGRTVGKLLAEVGVGRGFMDHYFLPMAAAIWSTTPQTILSFPASFLVGFLANHGLLQLRGRPRWRTIVGGSRRYVEALLRPIRHRIRLHCPVEWVRRSDDGIILKPATGPAESFDQVVFASHADQTLRLLRDASPAEQRVLRAFPYQTNRAVLHTDANLLPLRKRAWASWNYHISGDQGGGVSVTYDLDRLQSLQAPYPLLLTLNDVAEINPLKILKTFTYHHPAFTQDSIIAQRNIDEISGKRNTHFCGAYWGYGFHEDGVNSALAVARKFQIGLEACTAASTRGRSGIAAACP